jgi:hypothetical protein
MQHRTYLWLHFAMEEIRGNYRCTLDPSNVKIEDLAFPRNVEEAYEHLLRNTDCTLGDRVKRILMTIIGVRHPLSREMYIVLSVVDLKDESVLDLNDFQARRFESSTS